MAGWFDIAYSFLVGDDGRVYEGRGWDREGAHTYHYDKVSLALSFMGNFNSTMPTPEAITAAHKLMQCGQQKKVITQSYSLYGHRDVRDTECPGYTLYNAIRKWDHYNITTGKSFLFFILFFFFAILGSGCNKMYYNRIKIIDFPHEIQHFISTSFLRCSALTAWR